MKTSGEVEADALKNAAGLLRSAKHVVIFTGAGMSAESGIPTFRDALTGYWAQFDPMELATPEGFAADPERVLAWYAERRAAVRSCVPHEGYEALVALAAHKQLTVITQNVDRLHQRSGQTDVIELHGNLLDERCDHCWAVDAGEPEIEMPFQRFCRDCAGPLRPSVVWFGESLPETALAQAEQALRSCDLALVIGTSAEVYPAAGLPRLVKANGGKLIMINIEPTSHSAEADVNLVGTAKHFLPRLVKEIL